MPGRGTVVCFGFLDQALKADVAADREALVLQQKRSQEAGYAAVAIAEGVDTQEIEDE